MFCQANMPARAFSRKRSSDSVTLAVAFVVTVPVNRIMIGRGLGHAVVHQYHH